MRMRLRCGSGDVEVILASSMLRSPGKADSPWMHGYAWKRGKSGQVEAQTACKSDFSDALAAGLSGSRPIAR